MHPRWILLGAILVLGLAAAGAWQFLFSSGPARAPVGVEETDADAVIPEEGPLPDPLDVERRDQQPAGEPTGPSQRRRPVRRPPQTEWLVAGTVQGLHPDVEWTSQLLVTCQPEQELRTQIPGRWGGNRGPVTIQVSTNRAGQFRFALSELRTLKGATALKIEADDPNYMPAQTTVELPLTRGKLPAIPGTLTAELTTSPAGLIIGQIAGGGGGLQVAVFPPPTEDRRPVPANLPTETASAVQALGYTDGVAPIVFPVDVTSTDREGKYTLRIAESGNYVVVALGYPRPCLKHCPGTLFGVSMAPDITQSDLGEGGPAIEGDVVASFGPVQGARVHAVRRAFPGPLLAMADKVLHYGQGRLEYKNISATTNKKGRFVLEGLGRARYDLRLTDIPVAGAHPDLKKRLRQVVQAPATGVVFDLTGTFVVFQVRSAPRVDTPAKVTAGRGSASCSATTDQHGEAAMFLAPGQTYEVVAQMPPFLPGRTSFRFPENAERQVQRIDLVLPPPGKLRLVLQGPEPWPTRAKVVLESEWGLAFDKVGEVGLDDGGAVIRDLTPGAYHLTFVPLAGLTPGPWLPRETDVMIHENATTTEPIAIQAGGFLEVEITGVGQGWGVHLSVSKAGAVIPLIERPDQPDEQVAKLFLRNGVHRLVSPLPAGTVQVSVQGGLPTPRSRTLEFRLVEPQTQDAVIAASETTRLSFNLMATRPGDREP